MLFLAILVLALGWAGWLWAWGRDRVTANHGLGPNLSVDIRSDRWGMPRNAAMAYRRRRDVLGALAFAAIVTLLFAQAWSLLWLLHLGFDIALVAYAVAVVGVERSDIAQSATSTPRSPLTLPGARSGSRQGSLGSMSISPLSATPRMSLQPIREDSY